MRLCDIEGCEAPHYARGWCQMHYRRWSVHGSPHTTADAFPERFWRKVRKIDDGCWEWSGALGPIDGYGRAADADGSVRLAHRLSYELSVGPIPDGLHLDHLCRARNCVNPTHLEPVTQSENNQRAWDYRQAVKNLASLDEGTAA